MCFAVEQGFWIWSNLYKFRENKNWQNSRANNYTETKFSSDHHQCILAVFGNIKDNEYFASLTFNYFLELPKVCWRYHSSPV